MNQKKTSRLPTDQQRSILANSAALFASRGYPSTTMNDVADACKLSKATLYHHFADKSELLHTIADEHVSRLVALVEKITAQPHTPENLLRLLILGFMHEYENAHHAHRVLTEDVRFLSPPSREAIWDKERVVVRAFASAMVAMRPELQTAQMEKPLTMLLFGMMNWMFTWLKPDGRLSYEEMARIVADLFLGGFAAVQWPNPAASPTVDTSNDNGADPTCSG
ncbi:TetR/AcrR family transcriptional regulator [Simplicispira psychrophila]|uniref:TetR/AcrR family transcriptional regulator n=1 Tax=Simplicispira psychrophila TaxID=80882 RepID=UPI000487E128|nr:TetR/AcrR family transcriptional regulator [Simplicispira psychrophila]